MSDIEIRDTQTSTTETSTTETSTTETSGPYGVVEDPESFFAGLARLFGPKGYTDAARRMLGPYLFGEAHGDLVDFAGAPLDEVRRAWMSYRASSPDAFVGAGEAMLDAARAMVLLGVGTVSLCGTFADADRADERLEVTAVHVDLADAEVVDHAKAIDAAAAHCDAVGLEVVLEPVGHGHRRLVVLDPSPKT